MISHSGWNIVVLEAVEGSWYLPIKWCEQMLEKKEWHYQGEGVFEFLTEQDCTWFTLRWGS